MARCHARIECNRWSEKTYSSIDITTSRAAAARGASDAVNVLNREGADGWEAVGLTPLSDGSFAVLMKRSV